MPPAKTLLRQWTPSGPRWAIASLMRLYFDFNVYASLIFLVNAPFWIAWTIRRFADHQEAAAHSSKPAPAGR